jgi:hypothetical protein
MAETSAALFVVLTISTALLCKGLVPLLFDRDGEYTIITTVVPDIIILTVVGGLLLDNFYGIFSSFLNMINILPKNIKLPPKESLVVFQGNFSKQVIAGLNRLTTGIQVRACIKKKAKGKRNFYIINNTTLYASVESIQLLRGVSLIYAINLVPSLVLLTHLRTTMSNRSGSVLCGI